MKLGNIIILFGFLIILVGIIIKLAGKVKWIGRLPGDILIKKGNFTFYFPLATSILFSLILSLIFYLIFRFIAKK
ncbi:MAG: DUF2905 domain-containing protein [Candidatus Aminicenantia bacterium]